MKTDQIDKVSLEELKKIVEGEGMISRIKYRKQVNNFMTGKRPVIAKYEKMKLEHAHAESKLIDADNWFDDLDAGDWINRLVNRRIEDGDDDDREGTVRRFIEQDALESWFAAYGVNFSGNDDDDDSDFGEDDDVSASISPSIFFQQEDPSRSRSNM